MKGVGVGPPNAARPPPDSPSIRRALRQVMAAPPTRDMMSMITKIRMKM